MNERAVGAAGAEMFALMERLWPICRSITGNGVRETLSILREGLPELTVHEVPTGTECFDWTVPQEWNIRDAYVVGPDGSKLIDFAQQNLHVVNYSEPIDREMSLDELQPHLHSLPAQPDAIPYVTSYYNRTWGFCLAHRVREALRPGRYRAVIDSDLEDGSLTYADMRLPGRTEAEVFLSTYFCHPSMANDQLSGLVLTAQLANWLKARETRYTYRILYIPETIGSICYLSRHLAELKRSVVAGYVITCVGDERAWSFLPSRHGRTLSDRVARHVLSHMAPDHTEYTFLARGSDERQYCAPGIDLPMASIMRSKYAAFPEYHTSLDDLSFVTARGLEQTLAAYQRAIDIIEHDGMPVATVLGEPRMSDRGLRPTISKPGSATSTMPMMNVLAYADGTRTLLEIADVIGIPAWEAREIADVLVTFGLLRYEIAGPP
jgi:aminopeptidase-like protein